MPIDIHGLARRYGGMDCPAELPQCIKDYKATLQGRKRELLKPFGLDDLDKFKDDPGAFVKMVGYAMDSFREKKDERALYKKVYEDGKCFITMPRGPEGAAAAGSLFKGEGRNGNGSSLKT